MLVVLVMSVVAQVFSVFIVYNILRKRNISEKILELSKIIKDGAVAYLNHQFLLVLIFSVVLAVVMG
ncbi:MAG: hypothetical protein QXV23_05405, partial [Candidatus Bathyarchaeia archaeon]